MIKKRWIALAVAFLAGCSLDKGIQSNMINSRDSNTNSFVLNPFPEKEVIKTQEISASLQAIYSEYNIEEPEKMVVCIVIINEESANMLNDMLNVQLPEVDYTKKALVVTTGFSINRMVLDVNLREKTLDIKQVSIDSKYQKDTLYFHYITSDYMNYDIKNPYIQEKD